MRSTWTEKTAKPRAPQCVIDTLEEALRKARLETYSDLEAVKKEREEGNYAGRAGVALYLDSWCVPRIEAALAWAKGEGYAVEMGKMWATPF